MAIEKEIVQLGPEHSLVIETGKLALLAGGSVTVQQGETMVLVAACSAEARPGLNFFPLQVDYREKFSAAGRFPGGYFKREGRPSEKEICTARMTDRPLRPLFPKGFIDEVQVMAGVLSADGDKEADVLCMLGASAALVISDIPFAGPIGAVRVGRIDGTFVANPTHSEMANSDLDLVYAGLPGKVLMIEGDAKEISEEELRDALAFADEAIRPMITAQEALRERVGKPKKAPTLHLVSAHLIDAVRDFCGGKLRDACTIADKNARQQAISEIFDAMVEALEERFALDEHAEEPNFRKAFEEVQEETVRRLVLDEKRRMDGRRLDELRPIDCEVGLLPRTHGSALFNRGETQALVTTTLGGAREAQECDAITGGRDRKHFFLHYNFPNFSTGETGRIMGPGRREIGHGALAERSLAGVIAKDFPYTVRCVAEILGSNGSSSMASVCGASLAMMDAGVPAASTVTGISVGLVSDEDGRQEFLVDILGAEDHYGDMDFKVAGTPQGITGFQLDLKKPGIDIQTIYQAMLLNRDARAEIRQTMEQCIPAPRSEMNRYAPKIVSLKINPERIGALIGPGGKTIRGITESTGAQIDVMEDGTVNIFAVGADSMEEAKRQVEELTSEAEIGKIYQGTVRTLKDFGAFVEIFPGTDGLLHISEMADHRVQNVQEICNVGDTVTVKVIDIDDRGRVRLSRKEALKDQ